MVVTNMGCRGGGVCEYREEGWADALSETEGSPGGRQVSPGGVQEVAECSTWWRRRGEGFECPLLCQTHREGVVSIRDSEQGDVSRGSPQEVRPVSEHLLGHGEKYGVAGWGW